MLKNTLLPRLLIAVFSAFLIPRMTVAVEATPLPQSDSQKQVGWWLTLEAGASFPNTSSTTNIVDMQGSTPDDKAYYTSSPASKAVFSGSIGAGYQFVINLPDKWVPYYRVGLFYTMTNASTINGQVAEYYASRPPTYNYAYQVKSQALWLDHQVDLFSWKNITPFIDLSLGLAFNTTSGYNEMPIDNYPSRQSPDFPSKTSTSFAWRAGLGINYALPLREKNMQLGILWRYSDLGEAITGTSSTMPSPGGGGALSTPVHTNEVMMTFRYII
jgi:opacity protein-like surface antigen